MESANRTVRNMNKARYLIAGVLIMVAVGAVYGQTIGFGLVLADDINTMAYLQAQTDSFVVNARTVFTTTPAHVPYWMPVTMLTYLLDYELFNLNPGGHHLTSLLLHALTALLWFVVLQAITGSAMKSFCAAALWAIHPMNAAAVAWLAGRSAVLSTLFLIAAVGFYAGYVNGRGRFCYHATLAGFVLALLSKPSVVYLPLVLLILDHWPFGRLLKQKGEREPVTVGGAIHWGVVLEKVPFFSLAALWIGVSYYFFETTPMADYSGDGQPSPLIFLNGFVSIAAYVWKFIVPSNLPLYTPPLPMPRLQPLWLIAGSAALVFCLTGAGWKVRMKLPYVMTGGLLFLIPLLPHLGVCVGQHKLIIERYAYVPFLGLSIIVAWGGIDIMRRLGMGVRQQSFIIALTLAGYMAVAGMQVRHWKDTEHYFRHAVSINPHSARTYSNFGEVLFNAGKTIAAIDAFKKALQLDPRDAVVHHNLGLAWMRAGGTKEALGHYQKALEINPAYAEAHNNLGNLLGDAGETPKAIHHYKQALTIDPSLYKVHNNLAVALAQKGEIDAAVRHLQRALSINPEYGVARQNLRRLQRP